MRDPTLSPRGLVSLLLAVWPATGAQLFTDPSLSTPGLVGSYVNRSLEKTTEPEDWRATQVIAGTRVDTNLSFTTATWGRRAEVGVSGGVDTNWEDFSVQWDGYLRVSQAGQRFGTASDDGSRMWIDLNNNGVFEAEELQLNGWGRSQGVTGGERSPALPAGTYRIRIQYYEISGDNEFHLIESSFVPRQFSPTTDNPRQTVKAIVLNYDPRVPSAGGARLHEVFGWGDPHSMAVQFKRDLEFATGGALDVQIVEFRDLEDFPAQTDGFRYSPDGWAAAWRGGGPWHRKGTDLERWVKEQGLTPLVNSGAVDEVWCFGPPGDVDLFGETWMAGPNAFYINGGTFPGIPFDRAIAGYGFNYERGVDCMLHNLGHRTEDSLARPYGGWQLNPPQTPWDHYAANALESPPPYGVGTCEVPVNAQGHYDYANLRVVSSTAFDWANFPNLTGATTPVSAQTWFFGPAPDSQRDYFNWFWGLMPRNAGVAADQRQANWFKYLWDFNSYAPGTGLFRRREGILSAPRFLTGSNYTFSVRYYDQRGVSPTTLGSANVRVTGPSGYDRLASLAQVVSTADPRRVTAFYTLPAPGAGWGLTNQGDYQFSLQPNQVRDLTGVAFPGTNLGQAQLLLSDRSVLDVRKLAAWGQAAITASTPDIGSVDCLFDEDLSSLYRVSSANPAVVQIAFAERQTFRGFRFYGAGTYSIKIEIADSLDDLAARAGSYRRIMPPAPQDRTVQHFLWPASYAGFVIRASFTKSGGDNVLHLYDWTLFGPLSAESAPPTPSLAVANLTEAGGTGHLVSVTYSDATAVDVSSLGTGDLSVTGPGDYSFAPTFQTVGQFYNGLARSVTYWLAAPGGVWESSDNGTYTVTLQPGRVRDSLGNTHAAPVVLGAFTVNIPLPARRPAHDLTELNAAQWLAGADDATAWTATDTTRKLIGASSIRFDTTGGMDTWLRFPPTYQADWDLTAATNLRFSVYALNDNAGGFQENSPWIRLRDGNGDYFEYRYYENGNPQTPLNSALGAWKSWVVPLRAAETVTSGWRRTLSGTPHLAHIVSLEFHADTWGGGFQLWYDRVGFDLPVQVLEAAFEAAPGVSRLRLRFDQPVQASLTTGDLQIRNLTTGVWVSPSAMALTYDPASNLALVSFPGVAEGGLPTGSYRLTLAANAVNDPSGNRLATDFVTDFQAVWIPPPQPPAFTTQPESQRVAVGSNALFSVTATGTPPLAFQWQFQGTNLPHATNAALALPNVLLDQAGPYRVVLSAPGGSLTSQVAQLETFVASPTVRIWPASQIVGLGQPATLQAVLGGSPPFSGQWYCNGLLLPGCSNATLTLSSVQLLDAGQYTFTARNSAGTNSATALLTVILEAPVVAVSPNSVGAGLGTDVTFTAAASGTGPLSYQWQFQGTNLPGTTSPILTLRAVRLADAGAYTVLVSNQVATTSATAVLRVSRVWIESPCAPANALLPLRLHGVANRVCDLESSTDLVNWSLQTRFLNTNAAGTCWLTNTLGGEDRRFFRLKQYETGDTWLETVSRPQTLPLCLRLCGASAARGDLEVSSNLLDWTRVATLTNTPGGSTFINTLPAPVRLFYRLRRLP